MLYGKQELLEAMPPWQGGGDMILSVSFEKTTWNACPTSSRRARPTSRAPWPSAPPSTGCGGVGIAAIAAHEHDLLEYGTRRLLEVPGLRLVGTAREKASVLSFVMEGIHPHDIGTVLDYEGIAIRTGHHCAQPVMERFRIPATARASLAAFNTREELDTLVQGLHKVREMFAMNSDCGTSTRKSSWITRRSRGTSGPSTPPRRRPRASTRSAAIARPSS